MLLKGGLNIIVTITVFDSHKELMYKVLLLICLTLTKLNFLFFLPFFVVRMPSATEKMLRKRSHVYHLIHKTEASFREEERTRIEWQLWEFGQKFLVLYNLTLTLVSTNHGVNNMDRERKANTRFLGSSFI